MKKRERDGIRFYFLVLLGNSWREIAPGCRLAIAPRWRARGSRGVRPVFPLRLMIRASAICRCIRKGLRTVLGIMRRISGSFGTASVEQPLSQ